MTTKPSRNRVNRLRLTDRNVAHLPPAANPHWDTLVTGFGLRVGAKSRTWVVKFRVGGVQPTMKLGRYPAVSLAVARQRAKEALDKLGRGLDPRVDYEAQKLEQEAQARAVRASEIGFASVARRYLRLRVPKRQKSERSRQETTRIVNKLIDTWGDLALDEFSPAHVNAVIDPYLERGQDIGARATFERIRSIFKYALERGELDGSPVLNMATPGEKISRDRWLDQDELKAVWKAAGAVGYPFGDFVKLSFALGGQRRDDVAKLRRSQLVDMELRDNGKAESVPVWLIETPTKSDRPHVVPLSTLARELIAELPRHNGDYLLSTTAGERPISGFSKFKAQVDDEEVLEGFTPWRIHDIRRTVSTHFAEYLDQPPHVAEIIQNRRSGVVSGVVRTYNRAQYLGLKREALERWGEYLRRLVA